MSDARWYIFVVSKTRRDNLLTDICLKAVLHLSC